MSKKYLIIGVIIVIVAGLIIYFVGSGGNRALAPEAPAGGVSPNQTSTPNAPPKTPAGSQATQSNLNQSALVIYTNSGYSPAVLRVKVGTVVTFKNQSSEDMWTASAVHPTHAAYPTSGGCIGSTFDECRGDPPGSSWSFKFDIAGAWGYHNHLDAGRTGKIIVEP